MSQENVEVVRSFFDAYNARDSEVIDRLLDPEAEITTVTARAGLPGEWRQGTTRQYFEQVDDAWTDFRIEMTDYRELGERVVALGVQRGAGMSSRIDVASDFAVVFVVRNSQIVALDAYGSWKDALEAAGLAEVGMSRENVELAERVVAAVNERDIEGFLVCCADDIRLRTPWAAVEGVYEGPEAIGRFFGDLQDWAPDFRLTIERAERIGATRVLVFLRVSLRGRASGLPAVAMSGGLSDAAAASDLSTATVYDFAGGKVSSIRVFLDRAEALEAAGLGE